MKYTPRLFDYYEYGIIRTDDDDNQAIELFKEKNENDPNELFVSKNELKKTSLTNSNWLINIMFFFKFVLYIFVEAKNTILISRDVISHFKTTSNLTRLLLILTVFLAATACSTRSDTNDTKDNSVDTTISFKVDNYRATPKKSFEFNSLGKLSADTLHLVTCSDYVYFPFGKITNKSSLKISLLKDFNIVSSKLDTFTNIMLPSDPSDDFKQRSESIELELGANKLSLFLDNDPEASIHGYIRGGQIVDSKVIFVDNVKVGMSVQDFYNSFFDYFPTELTKKYKVVEFESCVTDVTHVYTFDSGQLGSVKFINQ